MLSPGVYGEHSITRLYVQDLTYNLNLHCVRDILKYKIIFVLFLLISCDGSLYLKVTTVSNQKINKIKLSDLDLILNKFEIKKNVRMSLFVVDDSLNFEIFREANLVSDEFGNAYKGFTVDPLNEGLGAVILNNGNDTIYFKFRSSNETRKLFLNIND